MPTTIKKSKFTNPKILIFKKPSFRRYKMGILYHFELNVLINGWTTCKTVLLVDLRGITPAISKYLKIWSMTIFDLAISEIEKFLTYDNRFKRYDHPVKFSNFWKFAYELIFLRWIQKSKFFFSITSGSKVVLPVIFENFSNFGQRLIFSWRIHFL